MKVKGQQITLITSYKSKQIHTRIKSVESCAGAKFVNQPIIYGDELNYNVGFCQSTIFDFTESHKVISLSIQTFAGPAQGVRLVKLYLRHSAPHMEVLRTLEIFLTELAHDLKQRCVRRNCRSVQQDGFSSISALSIFDNLII